ncbi:MAG: hypothetical protein Q9209_007272 [Squamulea sp. 1 TL-2023]
MEPNHFPFLLLPLEIRYHIYNELLTTRPKDLSNKPVLLWHDRGKRARSISLHPEMLRVSKQINAEATPLLYERNKFWFDLTTPEGHSCIARKISKSQALVQDDSAQRTKYWEQPGFLSPLCLQRLAHIEIVISADSVWANGHACDLWSGTGDLFMALLRILAEPKDGQSALKKKNKLLSVTVQKRITNGFGSVLFPRLQYHTLRGLEVESPLRSSSRATTGEKQMVDKVCPLIEAVGEKRNVCLYEVLEEKIRYHSSGDRWESRTTTREVSLKEFENL